MEQIEKSWDVNFPNKEEMDHNILSVLAHEDEDVVTEIVKNKLTNFVLHAFDHVRLNKIRVGAFLDREQAIKHLEPCWDMNQIG